MDKLNINLRALIERVEKKRTSVDRHKIIKIVAVSKYSNSDDIKAVYEYGQRAFGENRVQDLKEKSNLLMDFPIEWHFIGRLQKNKINHLIEINPFLIQSIDSFELAIELDKRLKTKDRKINGLIQINSSYEEQKAGLSPEEAVESFYKIRESCPNIDLKGVMSIGAHSDDRAKIQKSFELTRKIYDDLKNVNICSIGMSSDFELAIECGSNLIRVGSSIFK